ELFTLFEFAKNQPKGLMNLQPSILNAVLKLVSNKALRVKWLLSVREDLMGKLELLAKDYPRLLDYRIRLHYLSTNEATAVILRPFGKEESVEDKNDAVRIPQEHRLLEPLMERSSRSDNPFASRLTKSLAGRIVSDLSAVTPGEGVSPTQVQI